MVSQKKEKEAAAIRHPFPSFVFFGQPYLPAMRHLPHLLAIAALVLLSQCIGRPPPAPGDAAYHGKQTNAYRLGYHHGFMDGSNKLEDNFERHHDEYQPSTRDAFAKGYHLGHESGRHSAAADAADQDQAYQNGYDAGHADAQNGATPGHRRYRAQFTADTEPSFREGYEKGWHDGREQ